MEWKWSNGIPYKKSKRPNKNDLIEENIEQQDEDEIFIEIDEINYLFKYWSGKNSTLITDDILLDLIQHFEFVVSGDSLPRQKPDPLPFAHACERFGFLPAEAVVIGDSQNDAIAGRAAGCKVICVSYGYREGVPAQQLPCDALVDDLRQAAALVRGWNRA